MPSETDLETAADIVWQSRPMYESANGADRRTVPIPPDYAFIQSNIFIMPFKIRVLQEEKRNTESKH